eukprot:1737423-Amphidinium_carterae.1
MARWRSQAVLRYVREAPLVTISDAYLRARPDSWSPTVPASVSKRLDALELAAKHPSAVTEYAVNTPSNAVHEVLIGCGLAELPHWRT